MSERTLSIANFNLTFGENEEPLLSHFDDVFYPAITSKYIKKGISETSNSHFLKDVEIIDLDNENYVIKGMIIKTTMLEVKSLLENDELINTDLYYPSAPYSLFYIYLKNHRMILVKNQKGSPSLKNFKSLIDYLLHTYTVKANSEIESMKDKLPYHELNITGIPFKARIEEELEKVEKIKKLSLKFYPLNGDTDFSQAFEQISICRKAVSSNSGNISFNSPENKDAVAELISQTKGTVDAKLTVKYPMQKAESIIHNDSLTENISLELGEELDAVSEKKIERESLKLRSITDMEGSHKDIFEAFKDKIIKCIKNEK